MVSSPEYVVSDLMLKSQNYVDDHARHDSGSGSRGKSGFRLVVNLQTTQVELIDVNERIVVRTGRFNPPDDSRVHRSDQWIDSCWKYRISISRS